MTDQSQQDVERCLLKFLGKEVPSFFLKATKRSPFSSWMMGCEAQVRNCLWCFATGSYEFAVVGFRHVEPEEEGSNKVDRIKRRSHQVLSDIMGAVE